MSLLTLKEAAKLVDGLSVYRLRKLCQEGKIEHYKFGNKIVINSVVVIGFFTPNVLKYNEQHISYKRSEKK